MNRREFLVGSALAASAAGPSAPNAGSGAMRITVYPEQPIASIAPDFMGLGYEI